MVWPWTFWPTSHSHRIDTMLCLLCEPTHSIPKLRVSNSSGSRDSRGRICLPPGRIILRPSWRADMLAQNSVQINAVIRSSVYFLVNWLEMRWENIGEKQDGRQILPTLSLPAGHGLNTKQYFHGHAYCNVRSPWSLGVNCRLRAAPPPRSDRAGVMTSIPGAVGTPPFRLHGRL